ncbi:MAG: discoidin domain-containing protein, partial [Phycisphaerae bacterium]|nr:discoidin domain-containing protein [Phycisphaerae bacterium]
MKKQGLFVLCILMALSTTSYATMLREIWDHGEPDLDLAEAYMADNAPDETEILDVSMWPDLGRDNYIARLSGWLTVPTTGVYQFYVASDDKSRLYVSPNSDVEDAVVVARVDSWTDSLEWTKLPEQQSADISLKKGQILAVYAVMEEQGGGCDLSIGWTGPDLGTITLISDWVTHIAPTPTIARKPVPDDGAEDVLRDTVLSWTPGQFAATHNLYFSDNFADVNTGTIPMAVLSDTSYDPGRLEFGQTYYWRVDEVNSTPDKTVFKGDIWSFQAEPYSVMIPIDVAKATASSSAALNPPAQTVNGSGLNGVMHSAVSEDMWLSTSPDLNPWLMYEFDRIEKLDQMLIWNSNSSSEGFIGWGIKGVSIETSIDGIEWSALAEPTQLDRAPGEPTYDTPQVVSFGLVQAKFVRLNIQSNWGGLLPQFGVAEVQFYGLPVQAREPVPVSGSSDVRPDAVVTWRSGREAGQHTIYVSDDPNAVADGVAPSASSMTNSAGLSPFDLQMSQTYYWRVDEVNEAEAPSVWTGPVWSLNTATALVVDDFESYTNFSPNRPFQTWLDGYGYSADEFFSVEYPGNGTGAGIGHDIWSPASPNFDGSLMETGISIAGSGQSMPFYYNNTGGTASETQRTFTVPQNWTLAGAKTL